jgi:hypothetical protein
MAVYPAASINAWQRMLSPWSSIPRYTFTVPQSLPDRLVVPHGEGYQFVVPLAETTRSRPQRGEVRIGAQPAVAANLQDGRYLFDLPPQIDSGRLTLSLGDFTRTLTIEPMLRPELESLTAELTLPEYLGRPGSMQRKSVAAR